jgi:hypothetical protein
MATPHVPRTKPTLLMVSSLVDLKPQNQQYYKPDSYKLDPYCLPSSVYPTIVYDGSLFISLHRDDVPAISEPYLPGTHKLDINNASGVIRSGTVMDIPLDPTTSPHHLIQFDNRTTRSVPASDMASLIPKPAANESTSSHPLHHSLNSTPK